MKKVISILLAVLFILNISCIALADDAAPAAKASDYPFVMVHGMLGWGENAYGNHDTTYWGFTDNESAVHYLEANGCKVFQPTMGPLSSAWDRACELYAQLAGTVVDYGAAHSAKAGHARYGRDYSKAPIMGEKWNLKDKINIISHSFGGPTATIFAYLMENGAEEEIQAAPDDCSELFKGGHDNIFSITTLQSPHNGSPVANILYDTVLPVYAVALYMNIQGMKENPGTDFMLDQWGLTCDPSTGKTAKLNLSGIIALANSDDHAAYDMSLQGAKKLERYTASKNVYYFSVSADMTTEGGLLGRTVDPNANSGILSITSKLIIALAGHTIGGVYIDESWAANDGMVPVPSAKYPQNSENNHADYIEGMQVKKGVWYVIEPASGETHGYGVGSKSTADLMQSILTRIDSIPV